MGAVLVTGGTGVLGTHLVQDLRDRGREVRVLSRSQDPSAPHDVSTVQGDVRTGEGLHQAVTGVDCVVHAATSPFRRARRTEVEGVRNVLAAADAAKRLTDLVEAGPGGRADDIGGPEILSIRKMADQRREILGRRTALVPVPPIGPLSTIDSGALTAGADRAFGTMTWRAWLRARGTDPSENS